MLINANTILGCDFWRDHFKEIELGSNLKEGTGILRVCVKMLDIGYNFAYAYSSAGQPKSINTLAQFRQGWKLQRTTCQGVPVYMRSQKATVKRDSVAHLLRSFFWKTGQHFKPHHEPLMSRIEENAGHRAST